MVVPVVEPYRVHHALVVVGRLVEADERVPLRERVGDDYCVGCRFLGDEVIEGGSRIEDAAYCAARFAEAFGQPLIVVPSQVPTIDSMRWQNRSPGGHPCEQSHAP